MWKRRLLWAAVLAAALILYLFDNGPGTRALLAALAALPLGSALALLPPPRASVRLELPDSLPRGGRAEGRLILERLGGPPLPWVECGLETRNLFTGEGTRLTLSACLAGREAEFSLSLEPDRCGCLAVEAVRLRALEPFGLFARNLPLRQEARVLVLPALSPVELDLAELARLLSGGRRYSAQRPGYDPSETFRIREYVPGDPVRQIHWKLSEKLDRPLVRDFALPEAERLLLLLEPDPEAEAADPERLDRAADRLFSVSQALLALGYPHRLGWKRDGQGDYRWAEARSADDLLPLQRRMLSGPVLPGEVVLTGAPGQEGFHFKT